MKFVLRYLRNVSKHGGAVLKVPQMCEKNSFFEIFLDLESFIVGNHNQESTLVNVKPNINLDLNLLSKIQKGSLNIPTQKVCIKRPSTHASTTHPNTSSHNPATPDSSETQQPPIEICFDVWVDGKFP